ncbi:E3 ubiquitin-protein ligase TRIM37-like [Anopheles nili]|uniref:E3 ubiquitin-protein ligase TRIM37-like n=1 Tax=Anopheles nili TaxID=185578 RepID=UPI00237C48D8|nr:E3 ubiquitin-protein ligase TRIM37-like [Anopheles nili]
MASGSEAQFVQSLDEMLQCMICYDRVNDPRLCAQCSKLFCHSCLRQWLQKALSENGNPACPNCKCSGQIEDFVPMRDGSMIGACKAFVDENIASDRSDVDATQLEHADAEKVQQRLRKLLLETEAVYIESEHRVTHELEKQRTLFNQAKNNLIKTINIMVQQELREIHQQGNKKIAEINAWEDILTKKLDKHQLTLQSVKQAVEHDSPEALVPKQVEHEKTCKKLSDDLKGISLNVKPHTFKCHLIPEPLTWKYAVHKYSTVRRTNEIQYSDFVTDEIGNVWRLEVHPNGYDDAKNTSLSIFLQLYSGIEGQYHYSFELLSITGNHYYEDETYFELRKGWGQNHFIDLKSLQESFLVDDGFELNFSIRSLNLIDQYEKMKKRADLLATEVEQLKKVSRPDCLAQVVTLRNVVEATKSGTCLYSDVLSDDLGGRWRLQVYPGGNGECKGQFVSIFLELCAGIPNKYEFTVAILHKNDKKIVRKTLEYCIQPTLPFGWKTFLGREEFINSGYIQKDALSICLTIKPPSASHKINYLRQYFEQTPDAGVRQEPMIDVRPSTSQEPFESRLRKTSISFVKNLFTKSSSTDQQ